MFKIIIALIVLGVIFGRRRMLQPGPLMAAPLTLGRVIARVLIVLAVIAVIAAVIWSIMFSFSLLSWLFFIF